MMELPAEATGVQNEAMLRCSHCHSTEPGVRKEVICTLCTAGDRYFVDLIRMPLCKSCLEWQCEWVRRHVVVQNVLDALRDIQARKKELGVKEEMDDFLHQRIDEMVKHYAASLEAQ